MLGIYTRLSVNDEDSNSINNQLREGKDFAASNGFKEFEIYNEGKGISGGADIEDRPQLSLLMNDIRSRKITSIWFRNQNRLERNTLTFARFVQTVKSLKTDVYFGDKGKVDYNDPSTKFFSTIISGLNEYQRELQGQQTKRTLLDNARDGKGSGISAFGYTTDDNGYIILDNKEAEVVRRMFKMSLLGTGTHKIAETFNKEDIQTKYNKIGKGHVTSRNKHTGAITKKLKKDIVWSGGTIRNIIRNPIYKGDRSFGGIIYKVPPIFDATEWQEVNDNMVKNRSFSGKAVRHLYLLKGKISCGFCNRNYYGRTSKDNHVNFYICSGKRTALINCKNRAINIPILDALVWDRFLDNKDLSDALQEHIKRGSDHSTITQLEDDILSFGAKLKSLEKEKAKIIQFAVKEIIDEKALQANLKRIKTEESDYKIKINKTELQLKSYDKVNLLKMQNDLQHLHNNISYNDKLDIITEFIKEIIIAEFTGVYYRIKIVFNLPIEYIEVWYIAKNLNYGISIFHGIPIIIPLRDKFKIKLKANDNMDVEDKDNIRLNIHNDFLKFYNVKMVLKK